MAPPRVRTATHAGPWYTSSPAELSLELESYLAKVPDANIEGIASTKEVSAASYPVQGARGIIAPHAGYSYSGSAAAWAYKSLDWKKAKRVFLIGPSHHYYLSNCALSTCTSYSTPLGDLPIDLDIVAELRKTGMFSDMSLDNDEAEHSLEMHLPYIYLMLSKAFPSGPETFPKLVPILVGSTNEDTEQEFGKLLSKYMAEPETFWVISSDFCHWGLRFRYTYYDSTPFSPTSFASSASSSSSQAAPKKSTAMNLKANASTPSPAIHQSIAWTDMASMYSIELSGHKGFTEELHRTGNTVCGRHPIGVMMAALEAHLKDEKDTSGKGKFRFVRYERSSLVKRVADSSVSYASAYAIF